MATKWEGAAYPSGNYVQKVIGLAMQGQAQAGELAHVDIYHDDWCTIFKGGRCNCDPEVVLRGSNEPYR